MCWILSKHLRFWHSPSIQSSSSGLQASTFAEHLQVLEETSQYGACFCLSLQLSPLPHLHSPPVHCSLGIVHSGSSMEHLHTWFSASQNGAVKLLAQPWLAPHIHLPSMHISPGLLHASSFFEHLHIPNSLSQKGAVGNVNKQEGRDPQWHVSEVLL